MQEIQILILLALISIHHRLQKLGTNSKCGFSWSLPCAVFKIQEKEDVVLLPRVPPSPGRKESFLKTESFNFTFQTCMVTLSPLRHRKCAWQSGSSAPFVCSVFWQLSFQTAAHRAFTLTERYAFLGLNFTSCRTPTGDVKSQLLFWICSRA